MPTKQQPSLQRGSHSLDHRCSTLSFKRTFKYAGGEKKNLTNKVMASQSTAHPQHHPIPKLLRAHSSPAK